MARRLAIANQKGGVGKTATAVNLSAALAEAGHRVLLVDLDAQGSASTGVGVVAQPGRSSYEFLLGMAAPASCIVRTDSERLDVLPAYRELAGAEVELIDAEQRQWRLRQALSEVDGGYDFVIVDCPPALGMLTLNALCAADAVLVPLQCEFYALEGLTALLDTITKVRERHNQALALEGIALTMYDARTSLSRQVAQEVRAHFGDAVFRAMIPRNVRIGESPSHGKPVTGYASSSAGAAAYRQLARELVERRQQKIDNTGGNNGETAAG